MSGLQFNILVVGGIFEPCSMSGGLRIGCNQLGTATRHKLHVVVWLSNVIISNPAGFESKMLLQISAYESAELAALVGHPYATQRTHRVVDISCSLSIYLSIYLSVSLFPDFRSPSRSLRCRKLGQAKKCLHSAAPLSPSLNTIRTYSAYGATLWAPRSQATPALAGTRNRPDTGGCDTKSNQAKQIQFDLSIAHPHYYSTVLECNWCLYN